MKKFKMNIELKRKIFLEKFERNFEKIRKFEKFSGPGLIKKIKRLFFIPHIYIVYLSYRVRPFKKRKNSFILGKDNKYDL